MRTLNMEASAPLHSTFSGARVGASSLLAFDTGASTKPKLIGIAQEVASGGREGGRHGMAVRERALGCRARVCFRKQAVSDVCECTKARNYQEALPMETRQQAPLNTVF